VVPRWERKPVVVLALELTWPTPVEDEAPRFEPWTTTRRWERAIVEKVQGFDGVLLQRSPSLFLVALGVPRTLEQLPQRAAQAALALWQPVEATPARELCPELRQVVHWGPLVVDVEAADPTGQVLALGDTLTRPVRLLGNTTPGKILVSPEVAPLVEDWCELQACEGPFRAQPPDRIAAYTVVGLGRRYSPLEMDAQRPFSRFVGRERELATLHDVLGQAEEGRGQVVGMLGEPGIGKSRLCYEFTRAHVPHGWLRLEASAVSYGKATPYLPVIDLLKAYFLLEASDDLQAIRDKVTDKLLALEPTLQPILPALLVLLEVPAERPAEAFRQVVAHLQRAEFLYERSLFPELAYTFKHALTHEVTYGSLQQEQRRALHARIIEAIEALDANRLGEQVERLAHHALRGEVWEKAVTCCRQAGARAHDRAAFREAVTAFEQALQTLVYLPEDGDARVLAFELRLALAHALRGDHGRKRALMGEAATLARALDDRGRLGRVLAAMAEQLVVTGDFDGAIVHSYVPGEAEC
jgi:AAA ATPase domain